MARYIDANEALRFIRETNANCHWLLSHYSASWVYDFIESQPTADVVPKSEVERLAKEVDRLSQVVLYHDSVTEMKVSEAKDKVAREIFMHVDCITRRYMDDRNYSTGEMLYDLDELKKKYTNN